MLENVIFFSHIESSDVHKQYYRAVGLTTIIGVIQQFYNLYLGVVNNIMKKRLYFVYVSTQICLCQQK